jgi:hypothetical protein
METTVSAAADTPAIPISSNSNAPAITVPTPAPAPAPLPILPDPISAINAADAALASLSAEEKRLRDELAVKDPIERTQDTLEFAQELLIVVQAIEKVKQERSAAIRRLARGI